jgi:hypothetical protein
MERYEMERLTVGLKTKADKMRVLERAGVSRSDIARFLDVRYQQVRNTLEGDKRTGYSPDLRPAPLGPSDHSTAHIGRYFIEIVVDENGIARVPAELIEPIVRDGSGLFAVSTESGIFLSSLRGMSERVKASLR